MQNNIPCALTVAQMRNTLEARPVSEYSAQSFFMQIIHMLNLPDSPRKIKDSLRAVKPFIKELVDMGAVDFYYREGGYSTYVVPCSKERARMTARPAGCGEVRTSWHMPEGCVHSQAAALLAKRTFTPDPEKVKEMKARLEGGQIFQDGKWLPLGEYPTEEAKALATEQELIADALSDLGATSFDVACDDRGRFYFGGGLISPHNGRLLRWVYTHEDEVTLDHRTSFAQLLSILYGLPELGAKCGIGTEEDTDLYCGILAKAGITAKHGDPEREVTKRIIMPMAYGQGAKNAQKTGEDLGRKFGIEPERLQAVIQAALEAGKAFEKLSYDARQMAAEFADDGEMPRWTTPSGYVAQKDYFTRKRVEWCSGDDSGEYFPCSMTFVIPTKVIATQTNAEMGFKSVLVATAANIIQSLDAALLARVVIRFHGETGEIPFTIHDSYTVSREHADTLRRIVGEEMKALSESPEMRQIRKDLRIPTGRVGRIDWDKMNPLDLE